MWFSTLFQKESSQTLNNPIKVDIHSHLLPGIDDGAQTLQDSIQLIKQFHILGYTKLITTPHIISDYYPNNKEIIDEKLLTVKETIQSENIDISIEAGAEYYVDMNFLNAIEDESLITFKEHYVLFETAYQTKPIILEEVIRNLLKKGYIPVLAHPERYLYLHSSIENYKRLKTLGVLFQINAKSLYDKSKPQYKIALTLIQLGLVDFLGSDAHRMRDMKRLETFLKSKICSKMININQIKNDI